MTDARPEVQGLRFMGPLGSGGMGEVALAEDLSTGRRVAVKWFAAEGADGAADEERERFRREARTLARLDHPHLVKVHRLDELDGRPFMVLELVEGGSLGDRLSERERLPPAEALAVTRQAVEGLAAAWSHGVVHRDVKPSNLMFDTEDRLKVVDFGLAFPASADDGATRLTRTGFVVGSPHYMSPEQIRGEPLDPRSDLYSLGVVLFEMLAGRPPFEGRSQGAILAGHLAEEPPDLGELRPDLPGEVVDLVRCLIAKKTSRRPGSAQEVLERLDRCDAAVAGTAESRLGGPAVPWPRRGRRLARLAVLVLAVLAAVLLWRSMRDVRTAPAAAPPAPAVPEAPALSGDALGSLDLISGSQGREIAEALEAHRTPGLAAERLPAGGLRARLEAGLHPLLLHVALDGGVRVLPAAAMGDDSVRLPNPSRGAQDGWLVLFATERPLEPPTVLGARPEGRSVIYPAVLDGASETVYPAHDLLTWLEASLGERSGRWGLVVLPPAVRQREAVP